MEGDNDHRCYPKGKSGSLKPLWEFERHVIVWFVALVCSLASIILSLHLIYSHIQYYHKPQFQRHIVRIILMVPIYAICSFFSMIYYENAVYFDVTKNCYEAFVIYSFFALILNYLGQDEEEQLNALSHKEVQRYPFPFNCFKFDPKKSSFLVRCKRLTLQYVIIHPITTIAAVILEALYILCPDEMGIDHPMFWLTNTEMISVTVAMYGLVLFYIVVHDDLSEHGLIGKFVAVKFVIFFSFWQSLGIAILGSMGFFPATEAYTTANISTSISSFLICVEMVFASLLHNKSFPHTPFVPRDGTKTPLRHGLLDVLNVRDWVQEVNYVMKKGAALDDEAFDRLKNGKLNVDNEAVMTSPNQQDTLESVGFDMKTTVSSKQKKKRLKQSKYNEIAMDVLEAHTWEEDAKMEGEEEDFPDLFDPNVLIPGKLREGIDLVGGKVIGRKVIAKNSNDAYINIRDADIDLEQSNSKKAQVVNVSDEDIASNSKSYTYSYVPTVTFDDKDEL